FNYEEEPNCIGFPRTRFGFFLTPSFFYFAKLACNISGPIFSFEGGFGPNGRIESRGDFLLYDVGNEITGNRIYGTFQGYQSKIISSITTSTTQVIFHESTTKRKDINGYPLGDSEITSEITAHDFGALEKIEIRPLSSDPVTNEVAFCKEFDFGYTYFKSKTNPKYTFENRLGLVSIQESECGISGATIPPYTFQYYKPTGQTELFMPWRLTNATDAWGFYNGVTSNDDKIYNIPDVSLSVEYPSSSSVLTKKMSDEGYGVSDRNSYEEPMRYGALRRINYPEGGYTELIMEANEIKQERYDTIIGSPSPAIQRLASCDKISPNTIPDQCCPQSDIKERNLTITQDYIDRGVLEFILEDVGCVDDAMPNFWEGRFVVTMRRASDNFFLREKSFNSTVDVTKQYRLTDAFPELLTMGPDDYILGLQTAFCYGEVRFKEESYIDISTNKEVGGLRIASKKTFDKEDNLLLSKDFSYQQESDPNFSSGKLYSEPVFGGIMTTGQNNIIGDGVSGSFYYLKLMFRNAPYIPLADFQGYHIGYANVKESQTNGAYTRYKFNAVSLHEETPVFGTPLAYPLSPFPYFYDNGDLEYTASGTSSEIISSSGYNNGVVKRGITENRAVRVERLASNDGNHEMLIPNVFTYKETGFLRAYSKADTVDGIATTTQFGYNLAGDHLNPTSTTTYNSDGTAMTAKVKYPYEALNESGFLAAANQKLIDRNILVPVEETQEYGGETVRGVRRLFNLYAGDPYIQELENYEITYDAAGNRIVPTDPWNVVETVIAYSPKGQPTQVRRRGWDTQFLYWNPTNHLLDSVKYHDFVTKYNYLHSSLQLASKEEIDGQTVEYEYDFLQRLTRLSGREGNVTTDFDYFY
ncbi:MAG: hypothetical protein AAF242_13865, partial [Bacteroidota bacterium]